HRRGLRVADAVRGGAADTAVRGPPAGDAPLRALAQRLADVLLVPAALDDVAAGRGHSLGIGLAPQAVLVGAGGDCGRGPRAHAARAAGRVLGALAQRVAHVGFRPALVDHLAAIRAHALRIGLTAEDVLVRPADDPLRLHAAVGRIALVVGPLAQVPADV